MKFFFYIIVLSLLILNIFEFFHKKSINFDSPLNLKEQYNPNLSKINSKNKLCKYINLHSQFEKNHDTLKYVLSCDSFLRERFYHGIAKYSMGNNTLAFLAGKIYKYLDCSVRIEDILKSPYAMCSQQSLVFQYLLGRFKITHRAVGMGLSVKGHYATEVRIANKWHYFDPNQEVNLDTMIKYNYPDLKTIKDKKHLHNNVLYKNMDSLNTVWYINKPLIYKYLNGLDGKNARLFQTLTNFISKYLGFILLGILITNFVKSKK